MNNSIVKKNLAKRYRREKRFKIYGIFTISLSLLFLFFLLGDITARSLSAFTRTYIQLDIDFSPAALRLPEKENYDEQELFSANYKTAINEALYALFPEVQNRGEKRMLRSFISTGAPYFLRDRILENPDFVGRKKPVWILADDDVDSFVKGLIDRNIDENSRRVKDIEIRWIDNLETTGRLERRFNRHFFTAGDSREPEQAGIWGALKGSFYTMIITLILSLPLAVGAAIYLEEFAPQDNWWVRAIEVNINNLAAVPSIVFGILGLAVYIQLFGIPRSVALAGGLVLALMTFPTIIISTRAALKSVPPSIREAALALGASKLQLIFHHVLPLALPGILTGSIIGMAQALGETAPLLMIGMVAFVADIPGGFFDPATVLPVQIYIWSDSPERGFIALTSAAILVLLIFLIFMNMLAVILRKKFEKRW